MSKIAKELAQKWRHNHFKGKRDIDASGEYLERESQEDIINFTAKDTIARIMELIGKIKSECFNDSYDEVFCKIRDKLSELEKEY